MQPRELWARIWPLVLILGVTIVGWYLLSDLALHARVQDSAIIAKGPYTQDYEKGTAWVKDLLGLAATLAGFLGIAAASQRLGLTSTEREQSAAGGMIGVLAGATLLGVGGWPVPIALAAMVTGVGTVRVVRALRDSPPKNPGAGTGDPSRGEAADTPPPAD